MRKTSAAAWYPESGALASGWAVIGGIEVVAFGR